MSQEQRRARRPEFIDALLEPEAYPRHERPSNVELHETHISWLLTADEFVYKLKKPVNFGFLDFSGLEERHIYCQEEVRLNSRLSPDVYRGVVEIREQDGRYAIDGPGRIVEYAVKMRRLPRERWLNELLRAGTATEQMVGRIARRIASFHAEAETGEEITRIGGIETMRRNTRENFEQTREFVGITLSDDTYAVVQACTNAYLRARRNAFDSRAREGRIRDGHGDLHAAQICVENGIEFIDCIEFNKRFRYADVAADVAFTAMDLDYHGRPDLAEVFVGEYSGQTGDRGLAAVLDFYKCYRAYARGKVISFLLGDPDLDDGQRPKVIERAAAYFDLARDYSRLRGPMLLITMGLMGTGKTSLTRALGPCLDAQVLSSDVLRKQLAGVDPSEHHFEAWGEGIYSTRSTQRTYETMHQRAGEALGSGRAVVLDASYRKPEWRQRALELAAGHGAAFLVLETRCPDRIVQQRLLARHREPSPGASDGRLEIYDAQKERFAPTAAGIEPDAHILVDTAAPLRENVASALEEIYARRLAD